MRHVVGSELAVFLELLPKLRNLFYLLLDFDRNYLRQFPIFSIVKPVASLAFKSFQLVRSCHLRLISLRGFLS